MTENELSTGEAELYDRQIRLWGIESQEKLRAANVLLIGMRGLASEIAKNILLSGINSLTILDVGVVTKQELSTNFLLSTGSIGKKIAEAVIEKAQALNPLVKISADTEGIASKNEDFFSKFTIVIATGLNTKELLMIDGFCRTSKVKFICGDVFGMFGFSVSDLLEHDYFVDEITFSGNQKRTHKGLMVQYEKSTIRMDRKMSFPSIEDVFNKIEDVVKAAGGETKKRRNQLYYLLRVLLKFRDETGRNPSVDSKDEDLKKLMEIRCAVLDLYKIDEEKLKTETFDLVFGEVAPICAVVGGIIAQEVIKAVSHKEVPILNTFLLDPVTYGGKVEHICP